MHCGIDRRDDLRPLRLCHLLRPIQLKCMGPVPCFIVAGLLAGDKKQKVGCQ